MGALMDVGARPGLFNNDDGFNALQTAVWLGHRDAAAMLLERGADPNARPESGTPLYLAVQLHRPEMVGLLLDRGARWDLGYQDLTALQRAARGGEADMLRMMLDRGANPNASTATQPPPIILAADQGHLQIVTLLIDRGADARVHWKEWTPLRAAQVHKRAPVVEYLRAHGVE